MQIVGYIIFGLFVIYFLISLVIFISVTNKSIAKKLGQPDKEFLKALEQFEERTRSGVAWVNNQNKEDVFIRSKDNLKLHGIFIANKTNKKIMVLIHGYASCAERDVYPSAHEYYDMGYSLLIIDMRGCGRSEGKIYTFGYHEHEDVSLWVNYLHKKYKNSKIVLGGISMGATAALMVPNINKHVDAIIADSAFVNAYKQISYCLSSFYHLPGDFFMPMVNVYAKWFLHINFRWVDTVNSLEHVRVPILFIHGIDDEFVLIDNTIENYNKYKGKKDKLFVNYANHGLSYFYDRGAYVNKIKKFLSKI